MKRKNSQSINNFFSKISNDGYVPAPKIAKTSDPEVKAEVIEKSFSTSEATDIQAFSSAKDPVIIFNQHTFDIEKISSMFGQNIDNDLKVKILRSTLIPAKNYSYPKTICGNQTRKFTPEWLKKYSWLAYSQSSDGVFCKTCVIFLYSQCVGNAEHESSGQLVSTAFKNWKKALGKFTSHSVLNYHVQCVKKSEDFLRIMSGESKDVLSQVIVGLEEEKLRNRRFLKPIIETVLFCAEQELPLRGDNDSGPLTLERPDLKDGKFRSLLRFRANSGDINLKEHLENCKKKRNVHFSGDSK